MKKMKKKQYTVYLHLIQATGNVDHAKCQCPAGAGGRCKHVAATLFQLLDYIELGLSDIPDEKHAQRKYRNGTSPEKIKPKRLCCLRT